MTEAWGGWDRNIYYNPEALGFKLIGELEDQNAFYTFDTIIVVLQDAYKAARA